MSCQPETSVRRANSSFRPNIRDSDERCRASTSLDLRRESLQQQSASCDDSHWPSIPALRGPSPAARVTAPRRELLPLWGQRSGVSRKREGTPMSRLVQSARRIVVKVGSSLLTNDGRGLDHAAVARWAGEIARLRAARKEIVLVSSGAIAEGMQRLGWTSRPRAIHELQAAAAVG